MALKVRKFSGIDIGSNAVRLLTQNIVEEPGQATTFNKSSLVRVPVRLGEEVFTQGAISYRNADRIVATMKAFKLLMEVSEVEAYMACATSAMREAANGKQVLQRIASEAGIQVELIDGAREAQLITNTDLGALLLGGRDYLYIDVGGGSAEFTLYSEGAIKKSQSFPLGTVRSLNNRIPEGTWAQLERWIKDDGHPSQNLEIIGSGGNINKLHKMSGRKEGQPLSRSGLERQYRYLNKLSYEDRIRILGLNPDRADVIIPAAKIYLLAAQWSGAQKIHVPQMGLSDGMIRTLYEQRKE